MNKTLNRSLVSLAVAGALAVPVVASADAGVNFSLTGSGLSDSFVTDRFDWTVESILAQSFFASNTECGVSCNPGTLYGQGRLSGGSNVSGPDFAAPTGGTGTPVFTYEFGLSAVAAIDSTGKSATGTKLVFGNAATPTVNFFTIYYDPTSAGTLALGIGGGFGNANAGGSASQIAILSGILTLASPAVITDADAAAHGLPGAATDYGTVGNLGEGAFNLDSHNVAGNSSTARTIDAGGKIKLNINVCNATEVAGGIGGCTALGFVDPLFFPKSNVDGLAIDLDLNGSAQTPFQNIEVPSKIVNFAYSLGASVAVPALAPNASPLAINNYSCDSAAITSCDMVFENSGSKSSFFGSTVPEPNSVALLGLALSGLVIGLRRRRSTQR